MRSSRFGLEGFVDLETERFRIEGFLDICPDVGRHGEHVAQLAFGRENDTEIQGHARLGRARGESVAVESLAVNPIPTSPNAARAECDDSDRGDRNRQPAADRATLQDTARGEYEKTNAREVEPMTRQDIDAEVRRQSERLLSQDRKPTAVKVGRIQNQVLAQAGVTETLTVTMRASAFQADGPQETLAGLLRPQLVFSDCALRPV